MVVCWRYAEARAFEPFEDEALPEGKEPNELRIGLFQATGLAVKDKALLWGEGSSDPRMTFTVDGTALKCTSETVKKSLDPVWKQVMTLELPKGPAEGLKLQGKCEDVDEVSGADFMGTASARCEWGLRLARVPSTGHLRRPAVERRRAVDAAAVSRCLTQVNSRWISMTASTGRSSGSGVRSNRERRRTTSRATSS